jgi:hypothetical protein
MKKLNLHIATFLLIFSVSIFAQEEKSENKENTEKKTETVEAKNVEEPKLELEGFVDKNLNGIDDRIENKAEGMGKQKRKRAGKHFQDEDGDGINDNRCKGLGLGKGKGKKAGKKK